MLIQLATIAAVFHCFYFTLRCNYYFNPARVVLLNLNHNLELPAIECRFLIITNLRSSFFDFSAAEDWEVSSRLLAARCCSGLCWDA